MAVFTLPPEMITFYKYYIQDLTENAVNPDRRRYAVKNEAPRHYIDLDVYGDSALYKLPRYWNDAVEKYSEDTLMAYGIVPWHVNKMKHWLTKAFLNKDVDAILRLSADLGHYIGDSNVPLHTTENYNGQMTGQYGIHGFWESRLPELFIDEYDFFVGQADYIERPQLRAWKAVEQAHLALDSVLSFEKILTEKFPESKKYSFEERGNITTKVYSREFSTAYHDMLSGMVERRMRASVKMVGDFWYTCWVDGGQPDLTALIEGFTEENRKQLEEDMKKWNIKTIESRSHESDR
ncbi:MAG: zinc dependent phospholipase C family protein [bacterium]|nr:zinc dependent phospholipase C family protein [bacterium]